MCIGISGSKSYKELRGCLVQGNEERERGYGPLIPLVDVCRNEMNIFTELREQKMNLIDNMRITENIKGYLSI